MVKFHVEGMKCGGCASRVTSAVQAIDADARIVIDLDEKMIGVDSTAATKELAAALATAGYPATVRASPHQDGAK